MHQKIKRRVFGVAARLGWLSTDLVGLEVQVARDWGGRARIKCRGGEAVVEPGSSVKGGSDNIQSSVYVFWSRDERFQEISPSCIAHMNVQPCLAGKATARNLTTSSGDVPPRARSLANFTRSVCSNWRSIRVAAASSCALSK